MTEDVKPEPSVRPPRKSADERNAEARAGLEPLGEGERPGAVTAAAVVSAVLATANLTLLLSGWTTTGGTARPITGIVFAVLLTAAAVALWRSVYFAVVMFEAFLGVTIVFAALSIIVSSNLLGFLLPLVIIIGGGTLFWKLIRAMGRIQATAHAAHGESQS